MKVYLAMNSDVYDGDEILGVFSNMEKAIERVIERNAIGWVDERDVDGEGCVCVWVAEEK
jgi:hypothetical protein